MVNQAVSNFINGSTVIQKYSSPDGILTTAKSVFASGVEIAIAIKIPHTDKKWQLDSCLHDLRSCGFTQRACAFVTNMSASYVSKRLRQHS